MDATFGENVNMKKNLQLDGDMSGRYITCTGLRATAAGNIGSASHTVAVLDNSGWIYYRTLQGLRADLSINDYIVEHGTSGIWTYRKWASGVAECWGKITQTVTPGDAWAGTLHLTPYFITATTPIEFTGIDCVNASAYVGSGHTITSSVSATTPHNISIPALSVYLTGQQECKAYVHVMGRWK